MNENVLCLYCLLTLATMCHSTAAGTEVESVVGNWALNVADAGSASIYEILGSGLHPETPISNANDGMFSGDKVGNLLTITGEFLGVQIDFQQAFNLVQLGALVDPDTGINDRFKNTSEVEFLVSTDGGVSFNSAGFGQFGVPFEEGGTEFSYVNLDGSFPGVTNVRYRFTQSMGGAEGQRIGEVVAIVPEPAGAVLVGTALLGFFSVFTRLDYCLTAL